MASRLGSNPLRGLWGDFFNWVPTIFNLNLEGLCLFVFNPKDHSNLRSTAAETNRFLGPSLVSTYLPINTLLRKTTTSNRRAHKFQHAIPASRIWRVLDISMCHGNHLSHPPEYTSPSPPPFPSSCYWGPELLARSFRGTGPYISFSKAKMLSEDGRCFTFDASANGTLAPCALETAAKKKVPFVHGVSTPKPQNLRNPQASPSRCYLGRNISRINLGWNDFEGNQRGN